MLWADWHRRAWRRKIHRWGVDCELIDTPSIIHPIATKDGYISYMPLKAKTYSSHQFLYDTIRATKIYVYKASKEHIEACVVYDVTI